MEVQYTSINHLCYPPSHLTEAWSIAIYLQAYKLQRTCFGGKQRCVGTRVSNREVLLLITAWTYTDWELLLYMYLVDIKFIRFWSKILTSAAYRDWNSLNLGVQHNKIINLSSRSYRMLAGD